jgi:N-acetylglucosamine malate deacetylase 1
VNVLAIAVHPDDETLGCGGTLLKHKSQGDDLYWLIVTQAHEPKWPKDLILKKAEEVKTVAQAYGIREYEKLGFPTVQLDQIGQFQMIEAIRTFIEKVKPEIVYLVHDGDVHSDHHAVYTATLSVLKPFYMEHLGVRRVLCYETLSSTEAAPIQPHRAFLPTVISDITPHLKRKIEIMNLFQTEIQPDPLPRGPSSIRALARHRGATIGVEYAEAFSLVREIM